MSLLRANQPALTRVTPHDGNRRYIMPNVNQFEKLPGYNPNGDVVCYMPLKRDLSIPIGVGDATFQRASSASYITPSGLLKKSFDDQPRFESRGWLHEGTSTNRFLQSEDISNPAWSLNTGVTFPSVKKWGDFNMRRVQEDNSAGFHAVQQTGIFTLNAHTAGVVVEPAERYQINIRAGNPATWRADVDFNLHTLTVNAVVGSGVIVPLGKNRFLCAATGDGLVASNTAVSFRLLDDGGSDNYPGDGVSGLSLAAIQLEEKPFRTSYIDTGASAVTRASESLVIPGANSPGLNVDMSAAMTVDCFGFDPILFQSVWRALGPISQQLRAHDAFERVESRLGAAIQTSAPVISSAGERMLQYFDLDDFASGERLYRNGALAVQTGAFAQAGTAPTDVVIGSITAAASESLFGHITDFVLYGATVTPENDFKGGGGIPA